MNLPERIIDWAFLALIILLLSIGFIFLMFKVTNLSIGGFGGGSTTELSKSQQLYFDEETGRYMVPQERKPDSFEEVENNSAISLMPDRVEGGFSQTANVPAKVRKQLGQAVSNFIPEWETFDPLRNRSEWEYDHYLENPSTSYINRMRKYADTNTNAFKFARRVDSQDPPGVCSTCDSGLSWVAGGDITDNLQVIKIDERNAFVSTSGVVLVQNYVDPNDHYNQSAFIRSYSVLLKKRKGNWRIARIAASSRPLEND
jgi:hypothetical protein